MGDYAGLVVLENGINLYVDTRDSFITPRLIQNGRWEHRQVSLIEKYLHKDSKIIEVGSNVGYYTMNLSKTLKKKKGSGHIYAFEANPQLTMLLSRSSSVNGAHNVTIFNNIVYSESGKQMTFHFNEANIGMERLNPKINYPKFTKEHSFQSKTITLDETFPDAKFDIIRMDAEGSELEILKGAKIILKNSPDIIVFMEWATDALQNNSNIEKEIDHYIADGYNFYEMHKNGLIKVSTKQDLLKLSITNIAMTKRKL